MKLTYFLTLMAILLTGAYNASAQGMSLNTTGSPADNSAMLDVASTSKGILVPRMDSAHAAAISHPAMGLLIYQTNGSNPGFYYYNGTAWTAIAGGGSSILPAGAAGSILYNNGSAWVQLPAGTDGQILTLNAGVPTWTAPPYNNITATSGANGMVLPPGGTTIFTNSSQVYNITPATGYAVSSVTVDGMSAGAVTSYTFSAVVASHTISATFTAVVYSVGVAYGGGIIAYLLQPGDAGYSATVTHGLIAATSDQSSAAIWGCGGTTVLTGTAIGTGAANTTAILSACPATGTAAQLCHAYAGGGYTDWYLPSQNELIELFIYQTAIGGFSASDYWCSTQYNSNDAYSFGFYGYEGYYAKATAYYVRAVRSF